MANFPNLSDVINSTRQAAKYSANQIYDGIKKSVGGVAYTAKNIKDDLTLTVAVASGLLLNHPLREKVVEYAYSILPSSVHNTQDETSFALFALGAVGGMISTYGRFWMEFLSHRQFWPAFISGTRNFSLMTGTQLIGEENWTYSIPLFTGATLIDNLRNMFYTYDGRGNINRSV